MAQNNSLIVKSDYASRPSVPVGQKLNGLEINEIGNFQKVQGVNQGAFDNTGVLIDGTGSYNNITYDQPTLTITILSSVATSGNNSKTVQMTFVQECTLSFSGAIGLTIGIPQGNVIIPGTYIFSFKHDPINSKVNFINFSGTAFQLLDGTGTSIRDGNKIDLVSDTILSNLEWIITSGNDNLGFLLKSGESGHYYQNFVTKIRNEIIARADIAYMRAIDNDNLIGAAIEANAAGELLISNSVSNYIFNRFAYKADYSGLTWANELDIPHQKRVIELVNSSPVGGELAVHLTDDEGHANVVLNNAHREGNGSDHAAVALNSAKLTYPTVDKDKLAAIEEGAQVNVPPYHTANYTDRDDAASKQVADEHIKGHIYHTVNDNNWWVCTDLTESASDYEGGSLIETPWLMTCSGINDVPDTGVTVSTITAIRNFTIQELHANAKTAPSGGDCVILVKVEGITISTITIANGNLTQTGTPTISNATWNIGQILTVEVTTASGVIFPYVQMITTH